MESIARTEITSSVAARSLRTAVFAVAAAVILWFCARYSYLFFHSIAEIFSIVVACAVFMISWSSRDYPEAKPFVLLGIGYLFVAILDVGHLLSYSGMGVLANERDDATKLWVAARGLQALVTFFFALLVRRRRSVPDTLAFAVAGTLTAIALASIFWWDVFPLCLVAGVGLTPFKKASEYVICGFFCASIALVVRGGDAATRRERQLLSASFALTIASELLFTLYVNTYGIENLIGHFLKIAAFWFAYQALFAGKVQSRLNIINELKRSKALLESSRAELQQANLAKDKFFSILAHDLRNPIGGLVTISELLATRFDELAPARVKELTRLFHDGAVHSAELLECILQWARAQTGRLEVHSAPLQLSDLCEAVVELERPLAEAKNIRIVNGVDAEATAYADADMVAVVVRNLVTNAVKFTPRGGEIVLSTEGSDGWQLLRVTDNGVGMNAEDVAKLFRIDVSFTCLGTESEKGNGMGLILCHELVHLNKGTIDVLSEPARGSTFTVRLPVSRTCSPPAG